MHVVQIGNFGPPHSTENDLCRTMVDMGIDVRKIQEEDTGGWAGLLERLRETGTKADLILWTRTKSLSDQVSNTLKRSVQIHAALAGVPMVGFHLDRWWGLARETDIYDDPFFRCSTLYTADGHHDFYWSAAGVNHVWSPPAIAPHNCVAGTPRPGFVSDIAFVGSWQGYGHTEWSHRDELVEFLRKNFRTRTQFWPRKGEPAIRGQDLADLYASVKIVVGDSCLVPGADGKPMTKYCSDRVFETIGRGGFLMHPSVEGVTDGALLKDGDELSTWELGNWDQLGIGIDFWLSNDECRKEVAREGQIEVAGYHTYRDRLSAIFRRQRNSAWLRLQMKMEDGATLEATT